MSNKTLSIISYITIIGWLISYFSSNNQKRDSLVKFHLSQSLGLFICAIIFNTITFVIGILVPSIASILSIFGVVFLVLIIIGIINAANEKEKTLPLIGALFVNKFSFIN